MRLHVWFPKLWCGFKIKNTYAEPPFTHANPHWLGTNFLARYTDSEPPPPPPPPPPIICIPATEIIQTKLIYILKYEYKNTKLVRTWKL